MWLADRAHNGDEVVVVLMLVLTEVRSPAATTEELLALGAAKPDFQPGQGQWTVLVDPEGHPFCIAAA